MGSSSKRKSSKKKKSKISSQPRKMKKSRRSTSKKLVRRHDSGADYSLSSQSIFLASNDSHSLSSDDDSMSSVSISSSSLEDTYRRRKKASRLQKNSGSTRKRTRRRSRSRERTKDLRRSTKKRKRTKKNYDSKSRKKLQKKKPRRDVSTSSGSSNSNNCSTCKGESSSFCEESELQRTRIRSRENKKDKRDLRKERIGTKSRTQRSPSCSSYSRSRDKSCSISRDEEKFLAESKSRRLRSVITVPKQPHEEDGNQLEKEPLKEEIVYDPNDYPSSRSNDISSGGSKRELTSYSPVASDDKRWEENFNGEETFQSNHTLTEPSGEYGTDHYVHDTFLDEVETNNSEKETGTATPITGTGLGADDLETILRQKALENLRKFRGGIQKNVTTEATQKARDEIDVNQPSIAKVEIVQRRLPKQDNSNIIGHEVSCSTEGKKEISDGSKNSKVAKLSRIYPPDGLGLSGNPIKDHSTTQAVEVGSEFQDSSSGKNSSGTNSIPNTTISRASSDKNLNENDQSGIETVPKTTQSMSPSITNNQETGIVNSSSSASVEPASGNQSTLGGQGSNDQKLEAKDAKDSSEFQQKTMSVMRGGEMVQVNYKVYIPNRAPALARRQLRR